MYRHGKIYVECVSSKQMVFIASPKSSDSEEIRFVTGSDHLSSEDVFNMDKSQFDVKFNVKRNSKKKYSLKRTLTFKFVNMYFYTYSLYNIYSNLFVLNYLLCSVS